MHFENSATSPQFKVFLPVIEAQCTEVTTVCDQLQDKRYLFTIFLIACMVTNFKQPL
jgi:hypothetical protein